MYDHARRAEARRGHDHLLHARLLPHTAKNARGIPHIDEFQDAILSSDSNSPAAVSACLRQPQRAMPYIQLQPRTGLREL